MTWDTDFYRRRIIDERQAAANATDPRVAERHSELADLYAQKLMATSSEGQPRPMIKVVSTKAVREMHSTGAE
jgi:hypothetical protein